MFQYEILVDHTETANKCTILPLAYRNDFRIMRNIKTRTLQADILLHPDGQPIQELMAGKIQVHSLAAVDCVWRRLGPILQNINKPLPIFVSIPSEFVTAYPRSSRKDFDPKGGLATIEAIFIAAALLGNWDQSLLREFYFAEKFIEANTAAFCQYGVTMSPDLPLFNPIYPKNSETRRRDRGRVPRVEQVKPFL